MNLVVVDLVSVDFSSVDSTLFQRKDTRYLALTPSACYLLEKCGVEYSHFHILISQENFREKILHYYQEVEQAYKKEYAFYPFFTEIVKYINYFFYVKTIQTYINNTNFDTLTYITDRQKWDGTLSNKSSLLYNVAVFDEIITLQRKQLHKKNFLKQYGIVGLIKKVWNRMKNSSLSYEWLVMDIKPRAVMQEIPEVHFCINLSHYFEIEGAKICFSYEKKEDSFIPYKTFLTPQEHIKTLAYKAQEKRCYFFQHGSYLYKNSFLACAEVQPADINFVFNDYTKKLFQNLGAKKVYSVGSLLFNQQIKEKKKHYDFLYITQGHDYLGNLQYVDFPNSLHSFDGYELYQRHKRVIELFGEQFKDKNVIIRVHPLVIGEGVYVPFWELAQHYSNITIDIDTPIHSLIERSYYLISDYFTTEFINREIHYKRDIILFQGAPTPLPEETLEDMQKMFLLVDTVEDLENTIKNIKALTKNRKRYDDIIEYYSSKKCNTKEEVTKILEKEMYGR